MATSAVSRSLYNLFGKVTATRTTAAAFGGDSAILGDYEYAIGAGEVPAAIRGYMVNTGSTALSGNAHGIGMLGWYVDTVNGKIPGIGVEGRVDAHGAQNIIYYGVVGDTLWTDPTAGNSTVFAGSLYSVTPQRYVYNNNGTSPRAEGTLVGLIVPDCVGGAINYAILAQAQVGATLNVTARFDTGSLACLQVGGDVDGTAATSGIVFGSSRDTNLYRSAASVLKTDDTFQAAGYNSSDGTAGLTQVSTTTVGKSITVKNGLVVAFA